MPRFNPSRLPTAEDVATWPTSKLLSCFLQVHGNPGPLLRIYAAELDRRFPVPPRAP